MAGEIDYHAVEMLRTALTEAAGADATTYARMMTAFDRSSMHEYLFFQQGLEPGVWPTPPSAPAGR